MFYDVRISQTETNKTVVTVRKVFRKKRKRNKIAGLERNYVAKEKKYIVTDKLTLQVPAKGCFISNDCYSIALGKGDTLVVYHGRMKSWELFNSAGVKLW